MITLNLLRRETKLAIVILLLLSVIAIFVSPAVDLQPTAMRAMKFVGLLFAALLLAGAALCARLSLCLDTIATVIRSHSLLEPPPELFALNCALLC
jgi:hypothetical protein